MPINPIILYEGVEDKSFLKEMLEFLSLAGRFDFHPNCGGKDAFERILTGLVAESSDSLNGQRKAVIIVGDNDGDPKGAFKNVQDQIQTAGFTVPQKPREIVTTPNLPPLCVLMIPWDNVSGCLESLCLQAANKNYSDQLKCADALVKCNRAESWDIAKQSKLRMRSFLAAVCKSDPNTGLLWAWSTSNGRPGDIFPPNSAAFKQIADWFSELATTLNLAEV